MIATAFPLQWPDGWVRTPQHRRTRSPYKLNASGSQEELDRQLRLFGAQQVIVSNNIPVRRDGTHYVDDGNFADPGCAVWWNDPKLGHRVIACDRWLKVHENVRAIAFAIEALRMIERSGATQIVERAFTAFGALPPATNTAPVLPWWEVLDVPESAVSVLSLPMIEARYRELALKAHPDHGGSVEALSALKLAIESARSHYGAQR